jgi:hypothetical protein
MFMSKDVQSHLNKHVSFEVYRYQLVIDKAFQSDAFQHQYHTPEELKAAKNKIFQSIISENNFGFKSSKSDITSQLVHQNGDMFYFLVNARRDFKRPKKDFTEEIIDAYPNFLIAINNHPDVQKIAIQHNPSAFQKTSIVANFFKSTVQSFIKSYNISFAVEATFDKQQFWNIIREYPKQVKQVTFNLISPNMTNLTDSLELDLRSLHSDTNTQKTKLELNAEKDSYLTLDESSTLVNSIVDYASKGGGDIAVKVATIGRKLHTAQSVKDFDMEEQLLKSADWDAIDKAFKNILI